MSPERDHEAAAAARVLAELTGGAEETAPGLVEDEVAEVLRRLYVEGFGLLAYAAEPLAPRPELKARLLAAVAGDETQEVEPVPALPIAAVPSAPGPPGPAEPAAPAAPTSMPPAAAAPKSEARAATRAAPARSRRWPGWLAGLCALVALVLGGAALYLQSELDATRARLRRSVDELARAESGRKQEAENARAALAELARRHAFVTAPGVAALALRPPPFAPQPAARATLWIAADRRRWQLEAIGLTPEPAERDYQLWFVVDGLPRSGGVFEARAGQPSRLEDDDLPARATGVWITLERKGGAPAPTFPALLLAERPAQN